jgi:hypothetical protein
MPRIWSAHVFYTDECCWSFQMQKLSKRMWPVQRHAAKIYTRAAYKLFSEEVDKVTHYKVTEIEHDIVYEVRHTNA